MKKILFTLLLILISGVSSAKNYAHSFVCELSEGWKTKAWVNNETYDSPSYVKKLYIHFQSINSNNVYKKANVREVTRKDTSEPGEVFDRKYDLKIGDRQGMDLTWIGRMDAPDVYPEHFLSFDEKTMTAIHTDVQIAFDRKQGGFFSVSHYDCKAI